MIRVMVRHGHPLDPRLLRNLHRLVVATMPPSPPLRQFLGSVLSIMHQQVGSLCQLHYQGINLVSVFYIGADDQHLPFSLDAKPVATAGMIELLGGDDRRLLIEGLEMLGGFLQLHESEAGPHMRSEEHTSELQS